MTNIKSVRQSLCVQSYSRVTENDAYNEGTVGLIGRPCVHPSLKGSLLSTVGTAAMNNEDVLGTR